MVRRETYTDESDSQIATDDDDDDSDVQELRQWVEFPEHHELNKYSN